MLGGQRPGDAGRAAVLLPRRHGAGGGQGVAGGRAAGGRGTALVRAGGPGARGRWPSAVLGYVAVGAVAILTDPAPRIDVWVTLQQASDALARGVSFYEVTWIGLPGRRRRVHLPAVDGRPAGSRAVAGRGRALGADGLDPRGGGGHLGAGGRIPAWRRRRVAAARPPLAGGGRHRPDPVRPGHPDPGGPVVDRAAAAGRGRVVGRARRPGPGMVGRGARWPWPAPASSTWRCSCRSCSSGGPSACGARWPPGR